jgi:hypothetical protein
LNLLALEERAMPAGPDGFFLAPIHPPEAVLVAPIPAVSFPAQSNVSNGNLAMAAVRSDLFGVGPKPEEANQLEEMLANEHTANDDAAGELKPHRQGTEAAGEAEDANGVPEVVEDTVWLPRAQ